MPQGEVHSFFCRCDKATPPLPVQKVECSALLWALLLCRAAEGLTEPARQRGKGEMHRQRQTRCGSRACE